MAAVALRNVFNVSKRNICITAARFREGMPDPIEHATGLEKRELLSHLAGNEDPFDMRIMKRGLGTKECPNQVPSAFDSRIVGCVCEEEATAINWMWLYQGAPKRCACGHWFQLVYKAPI